MKKFLCVAFVLLFILMCCLTVFASAETENFCLIEEEPSKNFVKWVDFNASSEILTKLCNLDIKYHDNSDVDFDFCEALAYLSLKNGNKFSSSTDSKNLSILIKLLENGEKLCDIYKQNKYFDYYKQCYKAIFAEFIGNFYLTNDENPSYGLKAYFPLARGFWFNHYDDFGNSRSFGFKRKHLGHDLMGSVGTPVIAIEAGTVTELGWNRYGGWRVGIRSFDGFRYFYYAHLRKDRPYASNLKLGDTVDAGQVIGYLGVTGYSTKQNVNMKTTKPHLHLGLQLIFDKSQEDGNGEIWIDMYQICKFLLQNTAKVALDTATKEYHSTNLKYPFPKKQPH